MLQEPRSPTQTSRQARASPSRLTASTAPLSDDPRRPDATEMNRRGYPLRSRALVSWLSGVEGESGGYKEKASPQDESRPQV